MIYIGHLNLNNSLINFDKEIKKLDFFKRTVPTKTNDGALTLYCGSLSLKSDYDDIWENGEAIIIGRVFDKDLNHLYDKEKFKNKNIITQENIFDKIWGKYVYFHVCPNRHECTIIVDATGQLPLFYYQVDDTNFLFSSHVELIYKLLGQRPQFNWDYLNSYVLFGNSCAYETPFKNIFELPPTCCLKINTTKQKITPLWNPLATYNNPKLFKKDAVSVLQKTLKPWIEPYKNICVSLSGGLDSSSIVYCLKDLIQKGQDLFALNYFHSKVMSSNELLHARKVCHENDINLLEMDASDSLPLDPPKYTHVLKPNKPIPGFVSLRWIETLQDQLDLFDSLTFISGHGSDHIFMAPPSKNSVVDYFFEKGLKGIKQELEDISRFYRDPLWSTLKQNITSIVSTYLGKKEDKRKIKQQYNPLPDWIKQDQIDYISQYYSHPIYSHLPKNLIPGKYDQVDSFYEALASIQIDPLKGSDPIFYPFLYQPLVEFALSYPTYELFSDGYDRYPLRKSVSERFHTQTVWRRDKSDTTGILQLGIKKNLDYVLDLCLEGEFVKQGLVNKQGLHRTISLISSGDINYMWPFTQLASAELFLRFWEDIK